MFSGLEFPKQRGADEDRRAVKERGAAEERKTQNADRRDRDRVNRASRGRGIEIGGEPAGRRDTEVIV